MRRRSSHTLGRRAYGSAFRRHEVFALQQLEREHAEEHADARGEEAPFKISRVAGVTERAADQRGEECAEIDAHIKQRKGSIHALIACRIQ